MDALHGRRRLGHGYRSRCLEALEPRISTRPTGSDLSKLGGIFLFHALATVFWWKVTLREHQLPRRRDVKPYSANS